MSDKKNVRERLSAVMTDVCSIEKDGTNAFHKYTYTTDGHLCEVLHPLFVKHGLIVYPTDITMDIREGGKEGRYLSTATVTYIIASTDGDSLIVKSVGQGNDNGDKGASKAMTQAKKYCLLQALLLSTTDDAEADEKTDRAVEPSYAAPKPAPAPASKPAPKVNCADPPIDLAAPLGFGDEDFRHQSWQEFFDSYDAIGMRDIFTANCKGLTYKQSAMFRWIGEKRKKADEELDNQVLDDARENIPSGFEPKEKK
jgi:hypothetical protein